MGKRPQFTVTPVAVPALPGSAIPPRTKCSPSCPGAKGVKKMRCLAMIWAGKVIKQAARRSLPRQSPE